MILSIRSALLVVAALSASSVAPAQVVPAQAAPPAAVAAPASAVASLTLPPRLPPLGDEVTAPDDNTPTDEATAEAPDPSADLPTLVAEMRSEDPGSRQLECLAAGVYFESKSEPLAGQLAVAQVIANRVSSHRFADSYCGVIFQRGQFSFVRGHHWPHINRSSNQWQTAVAVAKIVDQDLKESKVGDALYFHARRVHPGWHMTRVASIGHHVFFR